MNLVPLCTDESSVVIIFVFPFGRHCSLDTNVNWKESWANRLQLYEQLFNTWKSFM